MTQRRGAARAGTSAGSSSRTIGAFGFFAFGFVVLMVCAYVVTPDAQPPRSSLERASAAAYMATQMLFAQVSEADTGHPALQVLRLLAPLLIPAISVFAIVRSLQTRLGLVLRRLAWRGATGLGRAMPLPRWLGGDLVVVIGLGDRGLEIARSALRDDRSLVVVLERDPDNPDLPEVEALGATVWTGDGRSERDLRAVFWKPPRKLWIMTGDTRENLLIMDVAKRLLEPARGAAPSWRVEINAHVLRFEERRDAAGLLPVNHDTEHVWTGLFNHEERLAACIVHDTPVRPSAGGGVPRILVVGLGPLGEAVFRELLLICHFPASEAQMEHVTGRKIPALDPSALAAHRIPEIVLVDADGEAESRLERQLPFLRRPRPGVSPLVATRVLVQDALGWDFAQYRADLRGGAPFTHVFIALGSEVSNLALAERICAWEHIIGGSVPIIVPMIYETEAGDWTSLGGAADGAGGIVPFDIQAAYRSHLAWEAQLLAIAQRIHRLYDQLYAPPPATGALDPRDPRTWSAAQCRSSWSACPEHDRRSNLALARYLSNRWMEWDRAADENAPRPRTARLAAARQDPEPEKRCEHRRWMAYQLIENFSTVSPEDLAAPRPLPKRPGPHPNPSPRKIARVNKTLVPFADLPPTEIDKDATIILNLEYVLGMAEHPSLAT